MRIGIATLPLHHGRAPFWLFENYENSIDVLRNAVKKAKIGYGEKLRALKILGTR